MNNNIKEATLIDVRSPQEYQIDGVEKAINIPLDQVALSTEKIKSLPKPNFAYCRSDNIRGMVVSIMKQHRVTDLIS